MKNYVVYASDDNYAPVAGVSISSLLKTAISRNNLTVYILSNGISKKNIEKLKQIGSKFNTELIFIDVLKKNLELFQQDSNWNITTFVRLLLSSMLPKEVEKVLYLDCDTLLTGAIDNIFQYDFENELLLYGVCDRYNQDSIERLGLHDTELYINAGVIFINLKKWRSEELEKIFLRTANIMREKLKFADQDIINLVCHGRIGVLPPEYNQTMFSLALPYKYAERLSYSGIDKYYTQAMYEHAWSHCIIVHFAGSMFNRPWQENSRQPYHDLFDRYLNESPWKERKPQKRKYTNKISSSIYMWFTEKILWLFWRRKKYALFTQMYLLVNNSAEKISLIIRRSCRWKKR